jgi:hypothetical protein
MCITPTIVHVPKGNKYKRIEAPCGYCWACLKNKQNDLVAKVLMELQTCDWSFVATFTYDDKKLPQGDKSAQNINKYHFKKLCAHMRKFSNFRYLAAGEYGKRKRRAHFHAAFFGVGQKPDILTLKTRGQWKYWPHGFSYFDELDARSVEYIAKYLTKQRRAKTDEHQETEWVTYSKYPPLGINFILKLADQYVDERVFPRTFRVNPQGSNLLNRRMQISGVSQNLFLERIFTQWPEAINHQKTEWMQNAQSRWAKWRAKENWAKMTNKEQIEELKASFRTLPYREPLTEKEKQWEEYKYTDEYWDWAKWLDGINKERATQERPNRVQ